MRVLQIAQSKVVRVIIDKSNRGDAKTTDDQLYTPNTSFVRVGDLIRFRRLSYASRMLRRAQKIWLAVLQAEAPGA